MKKGSWQNNRAIVERIVVEGELQLDTPAQFGHGESIGPLDLPLLVDNLEGRALLTGSSLAGALRSYLHEREHGYRAEKYLSDSLEDSLFGKQDKEEGEQSWIIISDALGEIPSSELRDGVSIKADTRTAEDKKKFDYELLEAGSSFPVKFELLVAEGKEDILRQAFAITLNGLAKGEISLGARKHRGFGRCHVDAWKVRRYNLVKPIELVEWLEDSPKRMQRGGDIMALLGVKNSRPDQREYLKLKAVFRLDSPILIRSGFGAAAAPDSVHLHSKRAGNEQPILSGTSLAGVIRSRAARILHTIGKTDRASFIIDHLFGGIENEQSGGAQASRVWVSESTINTSPAYTSTKQPVQNRVKIDRFSGGAFETALFNEQPFFPANHRVEIELFVENPLTHETGLILLVLKDLWTGDLPVGGESSIGRGRLCGEAASLEICQKNGRLIWEISEKDGQLTISQTAGNAVNLEEYVEALLEVSDEMQSA